MEVALDMTKTGVFGAARESWGKKVLTDSQIGLVMYRNTSQTDHSSCITPFLALSYQDGLI